MILPCFKGTKIKELEDKFNSLVKEDMPEAQQREIGNKLVLDYHKQLHSELNDFKKSIGIKKVDKYAPFDNSEKIKKIHEDYNAKIAEAQPKPEPTTLKVDADRIRRGRTNAIEFKTPIEGKNGAKLLSYTWESNEIAKDKDGKPIHVSDWSKAGVNADTGRDIVHKFKVEKDGKVMDVSADSVANALGFTDAEMEKAFPKAKDVVKQMAKLKMKEETLSGEVDASQDAVDAAVKKVSEQHGVTIDVYKEGDKVHPSYIGMPKDTEMIGDESARSLVTAELRKDGVFFAERRQAGDDLLKVRKLIENKQKQVAQLANIDFKEEKPTLKNVDSTRNALKNKSIEINIPLSKFQETQSDFLTTAIERVKDGKVSRTTTVPEVEIRDNGLISIVGGNHRIAKAIIDGKESVKVKILNPSEAYHIAKADGSNPELVKAVEDAIGKPNSESKPERSVASTATTEEQKPAQKDNSITSNKEEDTQQNSITEKQETDASIQSEVQQQKVPEQSSEQEYARTSPQQDKKTSQADDSYSDLGSEGRKQKTKVSRTRASASIREKSKSIRENGVLPSWMKADLPEGTKKAGLGEKELSEALAQALDLVADAIDEGKKFSESVERGLAHIKETFDKNGHTYDEATVRKGFREEAKKVLTEGGQIVGIKHASTAELRSKFNLGEYERNNATDAELEASADKLIKEGYPAEALVEKLEKGGHPSGIENFILAKYQGSIVADIEKNPSEENIQRLHRVIKALDKIGSLQSESFRTRKNVQLADETLGGYFIKEMESKGVETLTPEEKAKVEKEYKDIKEAEAKYKEKIEALEKENARLSANKKLKDLTGAKVTDKTKKTHEDFVKERETIVSSIKDKLKAARSGQSGLTAVPIPYAAELVAIAPDVAKLVKSLVEEGVTKLADVVSNVHATLKEDLPDITEKDVHDIIAGQYSARKPTKNEIQKRLSDLRMEAKKVSGNDDTAARSIKSRVQSEIKKLEAQLASGNFEKPVRQPLVLDKETLDLKDKLIELREKRRERIIRQEYEKRKKWQKNLDTWMDFLGIPRTIMSSLDYSAPLRQAVIATVAYPKLAASAALEMVKQGASQKRFDRWFYDLRETPRYKLMEQSGLYVADPHDPRLTIKEERFMSNIAEKVPIVGETLRFNVGGKNVKIPGLGLIKGSERAYVSYLNKMRVDVFNRLVDTYEQQGVTFEKDPKFFQDLARFVNNATGRGDLGFFESAAPVLNSLLFSPRLIASRVSLITDVATGGRFGRIHPEVRKVMYKDMAQFVGAGLSVLGLIAGSAWALDCKDAKGEPCVSIEIDPRSTDFGKIKSGNTRWDIWGGFQQYIRLISQVLSGKAKTGKGDIQELTGEGQFGKTEGSQTLAFIRGKLAPIPSTITDLMLHKTATGEKVTLKDEALNHLLPLIGNDLNDAMQDNGVKALFTVGVPSTFGVGVSTYLPRGYDGKDVKKDPVYSFLYKKSMNISPPSLTNVPEPKQDAYIKKREEIFKTEWDKVIKYGAMIDKDGYTTTDPRKGVKRKDVDALDSDDYSDLMRSISTKSTRRAEKAVGVEVGRKPKVR